MMLLLYRNIIFYDGFIIIIIFLLFRKTINEKTW